MLYRQTPYIDRHRQTCQKKTCRFEKRPTNEIYRPHSRVLIPQLVAHCTTPRSADNTSKETYINVKRDLQMRPAEFLPMLAAWHVARRRNAQTLCVVSTKTFVNEKRPTNETYTHCKETYINVKRHLQMRPVEPTTYLRPVEPTLTFAGGSARCATPGCAESVGA